jgi:hypothetical protein
VVNCSSGFASNIFGPTLQQRFVAARKRSSLLTRLTKAKRLKAGKLLALLYLLCLLASPLGFAFSSRAASCLVEDEHGKGIAHVHQEWTMRLPTSIPAIACKIIPHPFKRQAMTEPANDRRM